MPPLLCRILKLRKISAKQVLNNNGQTGVSVTFSQILFSWQPQKVIRWQIFQYSTLIGLLVPTALTLAENDFHIKYDQILSIFKFKRKILLLRKYHSF